MKRFYTLTPLALLVLLGTLLVDSAHAREAQIRDVIKKTYDVRPGGTLHLDMDRGNIEIETTSDDKVLIELERVAKADNERLAEKVLDRHEYSFDKRGNDVYIRSRYDDEGGMMRWRKRSKIRIRVTIRVPEQYSVDFSNGGGNVEIVDVEGRIEGRTGGGNISIEGVRGLVDIASGAGNIEIAGDIESAEVNTGAGNINLYGLRGAVEANTGAGNVYAEITRQPRQDSNLHSGAGNVTVALASGVSVSVDATAALGSAECDGFPLKVSKKWLKKSFSGEINGGGPELRMYAGVGNVTLRRH